MLETRILVTRVLPLGCSILLASLAAAQGELEKTASSVERARESILAIAKRYAEHRWTPDENNVHHGEDHEGIQVDTPDQSYRRAGFRVGESSVGIPYQWGGFSSIEDFEAGIKTGKFAGHLPKRGSARVSKQAVGVDCSGFVSRCWDLPFKHSTRSIGSICYFLDDFAELRAGDIINSFDGHVVLFAGFVDADRDKYDVYEAGGTRVKRSTYTREKLTKRGYKALRYKPLDPRWESQTLAPATLSVDAETTFEFKPTPPSRPANDGEPRTNPLRSAATGDWTQYSVGDGEVSTRSLLRGDGEQATVRFETAQGGKRQLNEVEYALDRPIEQVLLDFAGMGQKLEDLQLRKSKTTRGSVQIGTRSFDARRIEVEMSATILSRSVRYPMVIKLVCLQSDAIPLSGMLTAKFEFRVRWSEDRTSESGAQFRLQAFHKN